MKVWTGNGESFDDFLVALEARPHDMDICAQFPHAAVRVYVMGERALKREAATDEDIAEMRRLTEEGIRAGALGFTTSRTQNHRTLAGELIPCYDVAPMNWPGSLTL